MEEKDKNSNLEKSIQLAIQAQKDIQNQLLAEIARLKTQPDHAPKAKTLKFYNSQLQKLTSDVETINTEIIKSETVAIPDLVHKLDSLLKKRSRIENRIAEIQKEQDQKFLLSFENQSSDPEPINISDQIPDLINRITLNIQRLTAKKEENAKQIKELRTNLEEIQRNKYHDRKEEAMHNWDDEVATEKKFNIANMTRRQSMFDGKRHPIRIPLPNVVMARRYSAMDKITQLNGNPTIS